MPRRPDTRTRIERTALKLFAAKGVDATTTKDIAAGVGISEGAIYRHFESKDALVWALFSTSYFGLSDALDRVLAANRSLSSRIDGAVELFCTLFDRDPDRFAFILLSQHGQLPKIDDTMTTPVDGLARMFAEAVEAGECRREDPQLLAAMALGMVLQPATFAIYGRIAPPLEERARVLAGAVKRAVGATEA